MIPWPRLDGHPWCMHRTAEGALTELSYGVVIRGAALTSQVLSALNSKAHWNAVYGSKAPTELSRISRSPRDRWNCSNSSA